MNAGSLPPDMIECRRLPIVGIGASAGGLAALKLFLSHVPVDCKMAFVVILHREASSATLLEEVLQAALSMPVLAISDGMRVEPDHVYVLAPGYDLAIRENTLQLAPAARGGAAHYPIDFFLQALAANSGALPVGVVLSGTGSDGTEGLKAVKSAGGLTMAQEPDSAAFASMPRSAIEAGLADFVDLPERLPARILSALPEPRGLQNAFACIEPNAQELAVIIELLRQHTGHDFAHYKHNTLQRRIERRMDACHFTLATQYIEFLKTTPTEAHTLLKELLISVTRFFRDPEVWRCLRERVIPTLLAERAPGSVLRAWIAGCASGEEAYSLAMAFCEAVDALAPTHRFRLQIFATDLDQRAIARARRGLYPATIAGDVPPQWRERFFSAEAHGYRVSKQIREMVIFAPHNLLADPPFSKLDLVSCRNLLIYLAPHVHETVFSRFHYSMNSGAFLLLGSAESIGSASRLFVPLPGALQIYRRLDVPGQRHHLDLPTRSSAPLPTASLAQPSQPMKSIPTTNLAVLSEQMLLGHAPTAVLTNDSGDILHIRGNAEPYLTLAEGKANWNILYMVRASLKGALSDAFQDALARGASAGAIGETIDAAGARQSVQIQVHPVPQPAALHGVMVVFSALAAQLPLVASDGQALSAHQNTRIKNLEDALQRAREELQATREEMQTSREELTSTNEELQSTNEELTTSAEELRTMNEELMRAHAAVEQGLARYVDLFDSAPVGYFMLDPGSAIVQANLAGAQLLESERERLTGSRFAMFVMEAERGVFSDSLERAFQTHEAQQCEVGLWRADGKPRRVSMSALVADGNTCRVVAVDVSQQREVELALRDSEAQLATAQANAKLGSFEIDYTTGKARCSAQLYRMFNWDESQPPPPMKTFMESVHPEDQRTFQHNVAESIRLKTTQRTELRIRMPDGEYRWFESMSVPVFDAAGNLIRMNGTTQDINDRKQAQEALRVSEERWKFALEGAGDGVWDWDLPSRQVFYSQREQEMLGYPEELLSSNPEQTQALIHPDDLPGLGKAMQTFLASGEKVFSHEFRMRCKDGRYLWILSRGMVTSRDESGQPLRMVGTHSDITERKRAELALRSSEQRFRTMFEDAPLGIALIDSVTGLLNEVNARYAQIAGREIEQMKNIDWMSITHPEDLAQELNQMARLNARRIRSYKMAKRLVRPDGSSVWIDTSVRPVATEDSGQVSHLCMIEDITARRQAEEELRLAAMVYQHSSEAMMVSDADNNIIAINPAFTQLTGYSAEDVLGKNPSMLASGRHDHAFYRAMWDDLKTTGRWQGELWNRRKNGDAFAESLTINTIYGPDGQVLQYLALFSDITEKKQSDALIWQQANFDSLTSLPNRRMFRDRLAQDIKKSKREGLPLAILFIDLDRFKEINDTLGHDKGDILLIEAARRIRECVRESDTVARMGGDEFTVTLSELDEQGRVERIAQKILATLMAPFSLDPDQVFISASIGITLYPNDGTELEDLLKNADQAMYVAKDAGRNRFSYFTPALQMAAITRMRLTNDLRGAIAGNQFRLYFQPIVHLATGEIHKAEALIRWQHPQRGLISPLEFIGLAEASGLIIDIGEWVFQEAARWLKQWRTGANSAFQISVNQSPLEFQREEASFTRRLEYLHAQGLPGQAIVVEITEGLLLDASSACTNKLLQCRDAGIQVALDDFGTGYSSMSYLKKFDIDYLKIDQSFTRNLQPGSSDMALSEAIIVMAHKLDLKVIAEGVETQEQCTLLREAGCDYGQGYLFARPMSAEEFDALLKAGGPLANCNIGS